MLKNHRPNHLHYIHLLEEGLVKLNGDARDASAYQPDMLCTARRS
jgi:hypothetical protein